MEKEKIICSFYKQCKNYNKECIHCKWNAKLDRSDYLLIETKDGRIIRYL